MSVAPVPLNGIAVTVYTRRDAWSTLNASDASGARRTPTEPELHRSIVNEPLVLGEEPLGILVRQLEDFERRSCRRRDDIRPVAARNDVRRHR